MGPKVPVDATKIDDETSETPDNGDNDDASIKINKTKDHVKKDRVYRKRKSSGQDASDEEDDATTIDLKSTAKKAHLQSNLDADSDFSIDSDSDEEEKIETEPVNIQHNATDVPTKNESQPSQPNNVAPETEANLEIVKKDEKTPSVDGRVAENVVEDAIVEEHKDEPKIDRKKIWEKRTVDDVLVGAIQRYFERKLLREG